MTDPSRPAVYPSQFEPGESFALGLDASDPLADYRLRFHLPYRPVGSPLIYFGSHSLGVQPKSVRTLMEQELASWANLGVRGHFQGPTPWYTYEDTFRDAAARVVGARPHEVVFMNGLTINLHLMMETFYRPTPGRHKVLIEYPAFPSARYALKSQLRRHGYDPEDALVVVRPRPGKHLIEHDDIEEVLGRRGGEIALVFVQVVNFLTGQVQDAERIAKTARGHGCSVGLDLAHAAGNVPLNLHDWDVDFAIWCTYKYLNGGPGAVAGCFVNERHGHNRDLPRLAGWWGNDPSLRFRLQSEPEFVPHVGAAGWQVSNPPVLALVPVRASYAIFDEVGMPALRARSESLTGYLRFLLNRLPGDHFEVITPRDARQRGCQISIAVRDRPHDLQRALTDEGVIGDFREPDVIRMAPAPLYNTFHEVWAFVQVLARLLGERP
jgi:kynureninase